MAKQNLSLTDVSTAATTGCACCSTTGTAEPTAQAAPAVDGVVATYGVTGMTCGHCVGAITREVGSLEGVRDVEVRLDPGGTSSVTVTSANRLDDDSVSAAVSGAGYALSGRLR